jgi:lipid-A-disaccharide synthase
MANRKGDSSKLRVAVVACETSGDTLGAGLIEAMQRRMPKAEFFGMAGDKMTARGCEAWHRIEEHSVMGLAEVLPHLPRLLRLRSRLIRRFIAASPDVFVGVDSPDFNLPIEAALRKAGIKTVQYVSPQVWAWRQSRVSKIRSATDLVLCVLPFEEEFYSEHGVAARFVGHPLADSIALHVDPSEARKAIGLDPEKPLVALLPGSRRAEAARLGEPFLGTARWLQERRPELRFAVAVANPAVGEIIEQTLRKIRLEPAPQLIFGKTRDVIAGADAVLTASGTATLEALLLKKRMVVAHKISPSTYWLVRRLGVARLPNFSLPNLLSGQTVVPEFVQERVRPDVLGPSLLDVLENRGLHTDWYELFSAIHRQLRRDASASAAAAVLELLGREEDAV